MIIKLEFAPDEANFDMRDDIRALAQKLGAKVDFIDRHVSGTEEHYAQELNAFGWNHGDDWLKRKERERSSYQAQAMD